MPNGNPTVGPLRAASPPVVYRRVVLDVRPRTDADLPSCVAALAEVHEHDGYPVHWPADPQDWLSPALLGAWVVGPPDVVLAHVLLVAATATDHLLAAAVDADIGDLALVSRLFVRPDARRNGLARWLLDTATDAAGHRRVALEVDVTAAGAVTCYQAAGWQLVGTAEVRWLDLSGQPARMHQFLWPGR